MFTSLLFWNAAVAAAMAVAVYLLQRVHWLKRRPALRHALWLLVFLKLVTPPLLNVPVAVLPSPADQRGFDTEVLSAASHDRLAELVAAPTPSPTEGWLTLGSLMAISIGILGTTLLLVLAVWRTRRIGRLVRQAAAGSLILQDSVVEKSQQLNLRRSPSLRIVNGNVTPFLWVTFKEAFLVIPEQLAAELDSQSLDLVIQHELAHFARRDHLTNGFVSLVCMLCWWNPVVWWARRELRLVQEVCCDALVLAADRSQTRRYAETLLKTVEFVTSAGADAPAVATAFGSRSTFQRRIEMISQSELSHRVPALTRPVIAVLGILLIAGSPTLAQHDDEEGVKLSAPVSAELRKVQKELNALNERLARLLRHSEEGAFEHDDADHPERRSTRFTIRREAGVRDLDREEDGDHQEDHDRRRDDDLDEDREHEVAERRATRAREVQEIRKTAKTLRDQRRFAEAKVMDKQAEEAEKILSYEKKPAEWQLRSQRAEHRERRSGDGDREAEDRERETDRKRFREIHLSSEDGLDKKDAPEAKYRYEYYSTRARDEAEKARAEAETARKHLEQIASTRSQFMSRFEQLQKAREAEFKELQAARAQDLKEIDRLKSVVEELRKEVDALRDRDAE